MTVIERILFPNTFGMELTYSFVIIFCSMVIYLSTKEMYKISGHPGIKYFREAFIFFAFAYFFKSFISFLFIFLDIHEMFEFISVFSGVITLFLFMYASTMAIFYLLYSVVWKKFKGQKYIVPLLHVLVILISAGSILYKSAWLLVALQVAIFVFITVYNYLTYQKLDIKKRAGSIHVIYFFLFIFWMLNLSDILISGFGPIFEFIVSLASIGIFLTILYKVTRNVGSNKNGEKR